MTDIRCGTCRWWQTSWPDDYFYKVYPEERHEDHFEPGTCRRRAPVMDGWPSVSENRWCGEWEER